MLLVFWFFGWFLVVGRYVRSLGLLVCSCYDIVALVIVVLGLFGGWIVYFSLRLVTMC